MTKIRLPKDLTKARLGLVSPFDFNTFDIDIILPAIFFAVLAEGRPRVRSRNDPAQVEQYVDRLSKHEHLVGFDTDEGRRVLGRLVRTSLAVMGRVGKSRAEEQIVALVPYTLLAHKPGFPVQSGRLRGVDSYVYEILKEAMGSPHQLKEIFKQYFGKGITLRPVPALGGSYDGSTPVDVLTRVHLAFMDSFESAGCGAAGRKARLSADLCTGVSAEISKDLLRYLFVYHVRMPVEELARKFLALLNFELFIYTQKLVHGLNALVANPAELPTAFGPTFAPSAPEIYVDFTRSPSSLSSEVSAACVRRDLESLLRFVRSSRLVAQMDSYSSALSKRVSEVGADTSRSRAEGIQQLLLLRNSPAIADLAAAARLDERRIRSENEVDDAEDIDPLEEVEQLLADAPDDVDRVVQLILASQSKALYQSLTKWFWGTGGLVKPNGILHGRLKGKASWRYEASDELLVVLVQVAAARLSSEAEGTGFRKPIRLPDLLNFLRNRFGVVIERPIAPYEGAEFSAAARDNLQAMLGRLRQMGLFRDLSDDFTVQTLNTEPSVRAGA